MSGRRPADRSVRRPHHCRWTDLLRWREDCAWKRSCRFKLCVRHVEFHCISLCFDDCYSYLFHHIWITVIHCSLKYPKLPRNVRRLWLSLPSTHVTLLLIQLLVPHWLQSPVSDSGFDSWVLRRQAPGYTGELWHCQQVPEVMWSWPAGCAKISVISLTVITPGMPC